MLSLARTALGPDTPLRFLDPALGTGVFFYALITAFGIAFALTLQANVSVAFSGDMSTTRDNALSFNGNSASVNWKKRC